ncbi:MAG TPA: hypothetical protein DCG72_12300, partial [Gammaproteobacteria bacterium]|nr:hypothetical protein [Gammaproteobacteria bacterium]
TARLICPDCEYPHTDEQRLVTAKAGQYLNKKKEPPQDGVNRGFHLGCMAQVAPHNSAYSGYLHEVAAERESILKSDNPEKSRRVFVNTMDAESFAESVEDKPEADTLYTRREEWNPTESLPAGVLMLTMGVDVQKDRLEAIIVGWGLNNECWLIAYRVITGSPLKEETWNKLDKLRTTKWDHPVAANPMLPVCTFVDSGKWSNTIYEYTRQRIRAGVFSCKGAKMLDRPLMDGKATKTGRPVTMLYNVGTHEAKDLIYQRLELSPPKKKGSPYPQGYIHVPAIEDFGEAAGGDATGFFEMLLAEDSMLKRSTRTGEFLRFFDCPKGKRNEALDTFVYAMAAERVMRPEYETIAEGLAG